MARVCSSCGGSGVVAGPNYTRERCESCHGGGVVYESNEGCLGYLFVLAIGVAAGVLLIVFLMASK